MHRLAGCSHGIVLYEKRLTALDQAHPELAAQMKAVAQQRASEWELKLQAWAHEGS